MRSAARHARITRLLLIAAVLIMTGAGPAAAAPPVRAELCLAASGDASGVVRPALPRRIASSAARRVVQALAYFAVGGVVVLAAVLVIVVRGRPELEVWHIADLDEEFTARSRISTFDEYVRQEGEVFAQLERKVLAHAGDGPSSMLARYQRGLADPARWDRDWNRSFEWETERPTSGVLLVHGMSDAPYSLRSLGRRLHEAGAHVIGLRLPGHGTAPSGLARVTWEDMAAAVRLAMRHLANRAGDAPLHIVGYSHGAALAIEFALEALDNAQLPRPDGVVMLSPAIGVTRLAALAAWQERLGRVLRLRTLSWRSVAPECNPYKYDSFAINGGRQAHRLTTEIRTRLAKLHASGRLERLPRILAFQSIADATVSPAAVIDDLFARLPADGGHELVIFDINRCVNIEHLLNSDPLSDLLARVESPDRHYEYTLVTNEDHRSTAVAARRSVAGRPTLTESLGVSWPEGVYSLSHLALPFSPDDPLYGNADAEPGPGPRLGTIAMRGERGVLQIPASYMLRLRWNPFYDYVEQRVLAFAGPPNAGR